jgi:N-methylhydantoinase B
VRRGRVDRIALATGDRAVVVTGTGGGVGDPLDREPRRVLDDVLDGYVSAEAAREVYGVVVAGHEVDERATTALRAERRRR